MESAPSAVCAVRWSYPLSYGRCQTKSRSRLGGGYVSRCWRRYRTLGAAQNRRCPRSACVAVVGHAAVSGLMHKSACASTTLAKRWTFRMDDAPCHSRCGPPRFGSCPCACPRRLASDPVQGPLKNRHRLGRRQPTQRRQKAYATDAERVVFLFDLDQLVTSLQLVSAVKKTLKAKLTRI